MVVVVILREIVREHFATQTVERMHVATAAATMFLLRYLLASNHSMVVDEDRAICLRTAAATPVETIARIETPPQPLLASRHQAEPPHLAFFTLRAESPPTAAVDLRPASRHPRPPAPIWTGTERRFPPGPTAKRTRRSAVVPAGNSTATGSSTELAATRNTLSAGRHQRRSEPDQSQRAHKWGLAHFPRQDRENRKTATCESLGTHVVDDFLGVL